MAELGISALDEAAEVPRAVSSGDRAARIVEVLELDIVLGRLHPRERLIEQALAERFGTNRATIRSVLAELERRALVVRRRNVGATVVDLRPDDVEQIYQAREILETAAAALIRHPVPAAFLARLRAIQREHDAAVAHGDLSTAFKTNIRFHAAINAMCGNRHLVELIELLSARSYAVRSYSHRDPAVLERSSQMHWDMIDALEKGDRDRLVALRRDHLQPSKSAYVRAYRQRFPEEPAGE